MILAPDFKPEVDHLDLQKIWATKDIVIGLRADLTVGMVNDAWFQAGGGDVPAAQVPQGPITNALPRLVRHFFHRMYTQVLRTRSPARHIYQCPTPSQFRLFQMDCEALTSGLLVRHHLIDSHPHQLEAQPANSALYAHNGIVVICAHCQQVQRPGSPPTWDWVPDWVRNPPSKTSHGMCPTCETNYFRSD